MKAFSRFLPHLSFALSLCVIAVSILNSRNPSMGFFLSTAGLVLTLVAGVCGTVCAVQLIVRNRRDDGQ